MNNNNLTVRYGGNETFNVSISADNADKVTHLINWITEYKRGNYIPFNSTIECKTINDFISCRRKAKKLALIPTAKSS